MVLGGSLFEGMNWKHILKYVCPDGKKHWLCCIESVECYWWVKKICLSLSFINGCKQGEKLMTLKFKTLRFESVCAGQGKRGLIDIVFHQYFLQSPQQYDNFGKIWTLTVFHTANKYCRVFVMFFQDRISIKQCDVNGRFLCVWTIPVYFVIWQEGICD